MNSEESDDSGSNYTYESLLEKITKEKDAKLIPKLQPYFTKIISLVNDIKEKETTINYYQLKLEKIKDEYSKINLRIDSEENELTTNYISVIENEEFYLNPHDPELKELAERARGKKQKFSEIQQKYEDDKINLAEYEKNFQNDLENLSNDDQKLYLILKEYILHDKDLSKIKNDLDFMGIPENKTKELLKNNKEFLREAKLATKEKKDELVNLKKEIKNINNNKTMKNINHTNFINNMSAIKFKSDINSNNSLIFDNNNNNQHNHSLNNSMLINNNENNNNSTKLVNLNKTFYLRTNKSNLENMKNLRNFDNNPEKKSYSLRKDKKNLSYPKYINSDDYSLLMSDEKRGKKQNSICKRLIKNYCNKLIDYNNNGNRNNEEFLMEMKLKNEGKNNSTGKSLYQQRKERRDNLDSYVFINGNRYKQSVIGKATDTINGVY